MRAHGNAARSLARLLAVSEYESARRTVKALRLSKAQAKSVGELKLDDLRQSLRARDAILVMGATDMRVIPFEQVWKPDDQQLKRMLSRLTDTTRRSPPR